MTRFVLLACLLGCAADPALQNAETTVSLSSRLVQEAETTAPPPGAGTPARLRATVERAERRVSDAEQTVEIWRETGAGRLGWETLAPCLADALESMGEAMQEAGLEPPAELDQAIALARGSSERACHDEFGP